MATILQGTLTGIINRIDLPKNRASYTFKTFTVEVPGDYPQYIQLELTEDKFEILSPFKVGDQITADYFLNGNNWTAPDERILTFNSLKCFKITGQDNPKQTEKKSEAHFSDDDLPF